MGELPYYRVAFGFVQKTILTAVGKTASESDTLTCVRNANGGLIGSKNVDGPETAHAPRNINRREILKKACAHGIIGTSFGSHVFAQSAPGSIYHHVRGDTAGCYAAFVFSKGQYYIISSKSNSPCDLQFLQSKIQHILPSGSEVLLVEKKSNIVLSALEFMSERNVRDKLLFITPLRITSPAPMLSAPGWNRGNGWTSFSGSVLEAVDNTVSDVLVFETAHPSERRASATQSLSLHNFHITHKGIGTALSIDNIYRSHIENVSILCSGGAFGLVVRNWAFFLTLKKCVILEFNSTGVLVDGNGSEHILEDCHIASSSKDAKFGIDVRTIGATIRGGQVNVATIGNFKIPSRDAPPGGWAIRFFNSEPNIKVGRSTVIDVLAEKGNFVIIDAVRGGRYDNVEIIRPRINYSNSNVSPIAYFGNTKSSILRHPKLSIPINHTSSIAVQFAEGSIDCGVVCHSDVAKLRMTAHPSATRPYVKVEGRTAWKDVVPKGPPNITYHYDWVDGHGPITREAGGTWTGYQWTIPHNGIVNITKILGDGRHTLWGDGLPEKPIQFFFSRFSSKKIILLCDGEVCQITQKINNKFSKNKSISISTNKLNSELYIKNRTGLEIVVKIRRS